PLRGHELLRDVPLYDVSSVDLPGGGSGRTVADIRALESETSEPHRDSPLWSTWWLRATSGALLLFLVLAAYYYRLRQKARQFDIRLEERVGERTRIARELHDTLLQSVQGLVLRFHAVAKQMPSHDPARRAMEKAL